MSERQAERSDSELLAAYLAGGTGASSAFEDLVRRHGGMVYGTCRRVLGSHEAAEDASQAAFLVLARRAGSVRDDLEGWLHAVALNAALVARRSELARRSREKEAAAMSAESDAPGAPEPPADWAAVRPQIDEAVAALPAGQRRAVVLHYLEGRTQREVARTMGLSEGAVASHLHRGTERLRERLARRGATVPAAALGPMLAAGCASGASCPTFLLAAAAKIVSSAGAAGAAGAGAATVGAEVSALAKGAMQIMFWSKVKTVAAIAFAAAILAAATPLALIAISGEPAGTKPAGTPAASDPAAPANPAAEKPAQAPVVDGLRVTLTAAPEVLACSDKCRQAAPDGKYHPCAGTCGFNCQAPFKFCWACAAKQGLCQVCGDKKLPADALAVKELKAGETVMLALAFENTSREKLRICDYMLGAWKLKWELQGPDAQSVRTDPTGVTFMLAAITGANFPEIAPGARLVLPIRLGGNPPAINQGTSVTYLLKPGAYKLSATYTNREDSYFDNQKRLKVQPDGKVWKGEVKTSVLELNVAGEVKPAPEPRGQGMFRPIMAN